MTGDPAKLQKADAWREPAAMAALTVLFALAVAPFVHRHTVGESDLTRMLSAMVRGSVEGSGLAGVPHYGLQFSFGYYRLMYALVPPAVMRDPARLAFVMNAIGYLSAVLLVPVLWAYVRALAGSARAAAATTLLFMTSPIVLLIATSGHPLTPALLLGTLAGRLLLDGTAGPRPAPAHVVVATALAWSALTLRAEVALMFPLLVLVPRHDAATGARAWLTGAAVRCGALALATAGFLVARAAFFATLPHGTGVDSAAEPLVSLWTFLASFYRLSDIPTGVQFAVLGCGIATAGAAAVLVLARRAALLERAHWVAVIAAAVPAIAMWLPNPRPTRHFILLDLALALLIGLGLANQRRLARATVVLACALALGNQLLAELAYPTLVRHHDWPYPSATARRSSQSAPMGAFWGEGPAQLAHQEALRAEGERVARASRSQARLMLFADEPYYLIAYLSAADPALRSRDTLVDHVSMTTFESPARSLVVVTKYLARPRDVQREMLEVGPFASYPYYVQPLTRAREDVGPYPRPPLELR